MQPNLRLRQDGEPLDVGEGAAVCVGSVCGVGDARMRTGGNQVGE